MKAVSFVLVLLVSVASMAECLGEAQIIAKVDSIIYRDMFAGCKVSVNPNSIVQYNVNMTCPLDLSEVLAEGVEVGIVNGHDCALNEGDVLSGVIVKKSWGTLELE